MRVQLSLVGMCLLLSSAVVEGEAPAPTMWGVEAVEGPLLFYITEGGSPGAGVAEHWLVDPTGAGQPQRWMATRGNIRPIHRLSRDALLCHDFRTGRLGLVDLTAGRWTELAPGSGRDILFAAEGTRVVWLREGQLMSYGVVGGTTRLCPEETFSRVLAGTESELLAVTTDGRILAISRQGDGGRVLGELGAGRAAQVTEWALSPTGRYLAVALAPPGGMLSLRQLRVLDVAGGAWLLERDGLRVEQPLARSSLPGLGLVWTSASTLSYQESWHVSMEPERLLAGGRELSFGAAGEVSEQVLGDRPLELRMPVAARLDRGLFAEEPGRLFYAGVAEPAWSCAPGAEQYWNELVISADGRFAALLDRSACCIRVFDGETRQQTLSVAGWGHGLTLLSVAEP